MTAKDVVKTTISNTHFTPDCQNKWDFDIDLIRMSSRGYDRTEKSFYVGYFLGNEIDFVALIEDELFDDDFDKLKVKVKEWYLNNFEKALKIALKSKKLKWWTGFGRN